MSIGGIEIATIARSQDYTAIKHQEDYKGQIAQNNGATQTAKQVDTMMHQVSAGDNADGQHKKFDAKEKGNGQYSEQKQKKDQKDKKDGRVTCINHGGFDIKI